jgi:hypothetical protein
MNSTIHSCGVTAGNRPSEQLNCQNNRVVLTPRNGWMRSGCAADAQQARSVTTAVVEAKKDRCAYDAAPKSPEGSADAPPPPLIEEIAPILPQ